MRSRRRRGRASAGGSASRRARRARALIKRVLPRRRRRSTVSFRYVQHTYHTHRAHHTHLFSSLPSPPVPSRSLPFQAGPLGLNISNEGGSGKAGKLLVTRATGQAETLGIRIKDEVVSLNGKKCLNKVRAQPPPHYPKHHTIPLLPQTIPLPHHYPTTPQIPHPITPLIPHHPTTTPTRRRRSSRRWFRSRHDP